MVRVKVMYELVDGIVSIAGGTFGYLAAIGKIRISKTEEQAIEWQNKYGRTLKIAAPIAILFGIFRTAQVLIGF